MKSKKIMAVAAFLLLFLSGTANNYSLPWGINVDPETKNDAEFWKEQAYVNLNYMKYKVNEIISNDSLKNK